MTFVPQLSENSANVDSIEYYLDKKHIATYTEMPFVLQYKLTDYKVGDYILEYTIFYTDKKYTPPFTYTITITTNISIY